MGAVAHAEQLAPLVRGPAGGLADERAFVGVGRADPLVVGDFLVFAAFVEAAAAFNQLKGSTLGQMRIYGISKTKADFMLFRNGYKLIFSMKQPGVITVSYSTAVAQYVPGSVANPDEAKSSDMLRAFETRGTWK